ncbi:hypothetical protein PR202_gb05244 [Eleusine coracana subsp. coracana]|uniref:Uncharacterized protein n=1 Tax=Eleusine coracana subsp. coracana TaxID=191504 RepID=A0AAV5E6R1_ELECO|nr:hypothetical protein PR202_gb05244 [Eleusine coracana subsp. coracana]
MSVVETNDEVVRIDLHAMVGAEQDVTVTKDITSRKMLSTPTEEAEELGQGAGDSAPAMAAHEKEGIEGGAEGSEDRDIRRETEACDNFGFGLTRGGGVDNSEMVEELLCSGR